MQALTQRKVDFAFRVYQALLGGAAGGDEAQAMDTDTQVGVKGGLISLYHSCLDAAAGSFVVQRDATFCYVVCVVFCIALCQKELLLWEVMEQKVLQLVDLSACMGPECAHRCSFPSSQFLLKMGTCVVEELDLLSLQIKRQDHLLL